MNTENTVILKPPLTAQEPLAAGTWIEGLEIQEVIGTGGFGIVYKAWDPALQRQVALKEYFPGTLARRGPAGEVALRDERHSGTYAAGLCSFVNEARLLAQFEHASLVKVYRFWEVAGTAYMVMPFYKGPTLAQYLANRPEPLAQGVLLNWLSALTGALALMHGQQCFHRDVSPENILIQEDNGLPVLLDFGAARRAIGDKSQKFTVILKTSYAPIEQYAELPSLEQGPWTDVYALAAVAHLLITGHTPPPAVGRMVCDNYMPLAGQGNLPYTRELRQAVDKALAIQPDDRTQSMGEFWEQLSRGNSIVQDKKAENRPARPGSKTENLTPAVCGWKKYLWPLSTSGTCMKLAWWRWACLVLLMTLIGWLGWSNQKRPGAAPSVQEDRRPAETDQTTEPVADPVNPLFQAVLDKADSQLQVSMQNTVLKIGEDLLDFQLVSPFTGYVAVYVFASDRSLIRLLPNPRTPLLKIQAGQALRLPPPEDPIEAAGPAGVNQFLVIVTEQVRSDGHLDTELNTGFEQIRGTPGQLEGISPCSFKDCRDRLATAWFPVEEVD